MHCDQKTSIEFIFPRMFALKMDTGDRQDNSAAHSVELN